MFYFAYGSNMSVRRLRRRVAEAAPLGTATLGGYQLRFHKVGQDGSGKCNAFATGDARDIMPGVLFELPDEAWSVLDRIEGVGRGYTRAPVQLDSGSGGAVEAYTYLATRLDDRLKPYCWYKRHVLAGALDAGLPQLYIEAICAVTTLRDPNRRRRAREHAVHGRGVRRG